MRPVYQEIADAFAVENGFDGAKHNPHRARFLKEGEEGYSAGFRDEAGRIGVPFDNQSYEITCDTNGARWASAEDAANAALYRH